MRRLFSFKNLCIFLILLLLFSAGLLLGYKKYADVRILHYKDLAAISQSTYESVALSAFTLDGFDEETYTAYWAKTLYIATDTIKDARTLAWYLAKIAASGNSVSTIYIGVDPATMDLDAFFALVAAYPAYTFEIIPAYSPISSWCALTDAALEKKLSAYEALCQGTLSLENAHVYGYFAATGIIDDSNFAGGALIADVASQILLNSTTASDYYLSESRLDLTFSIFKEAILATKAAGEVTYSDLSDLDVVFIGDSVFGNYTDAVSIPGFFSALTGAKVYNCAVGGRSAAKEEAVNQGLVYHIQAFLDHTAYTYSNAENANAAMDAFYEAHTADRDLCFIINFGLNDYFDGNAIALEDAYDITSYTGAFRTGIDLLEKAYPDATIILVAPNFTTYFSNGQEINGIYAGTLRDYSDALCAVAEEYGLLSICLLDELPIDADNAFYYLDGICHPNITGRLLVAKLLAAAFVE